MVATWWTAWCAVTNSNPWTGSYWSPAQTRPRLLRGSLALRGAAGPRAGADAPRHAPPSRDRPFARRRRGPLASPSSGSPGRTARTGAPTPQALALRTSSMIRCRNSGAYGRWLFGIVDAPFRPNHGVSTKPVNSTLCLGLAPASLGSLLGDLLSLCCRQGFSTPNLFVVGYGLYGLCGVRSSALAKDALPSYCHRHSSRPKASSAIANGKM